MLIGFSRFLVVLWFMPQDPLLSTQGMAHTYFVAVLHLRSGAVRGVVSWLRRRPVGHSLPAGAVLDVCRSKQELIMENALLRQQLIVLRRQVNRP